MKKLVAARRLTVGSDCTGLATEVLALERILDLPIHHVFMCDRDKHVQQFLGQNYPGVPLYPDVACPARKEAPHVDIYVAGFPCQPYSAAGKNGGLADQRGGPVLNAVLDYIVSRLPKIFVLENVLGLLNKKHRDASR